MTKTDIVVAGNNFLLNTGLKTLVNESADFTLVAEANNEEQLLQMAATKKATVLIIDLSTILLKTEVLALLKETAPDLKILAINNGQPKHVITKALDNGVTSYLMLHCDKDEITEAIHKTAKGERFLCGQIVDILIGNKKTDSHDSNCPLYAYCGGAAVSEREMDIIRCVAEGCSNQEIAEKLFISIHTVTTHRKNIMNKLGINNTAGLVMYAVREHLIQPN